MYIHCIVVHFHYHFFHGTATIHFFFIVGIAVVVNSIKVFSVAMQMQKWVPFALLSSYEIFRTAV